MLVSVSIYRLQVKGIRSIPLKFFEEGGSFRGGKVAQLLSLGVVCPCTILQSGKRLDMPTLAAGPACFFQKSSFPPLSSSQPVEVFELLFEGGSSVVEGVELFQAEFGDKLVFNCNP